MKNVAAVYLCIAGVRLNWQRLWLATEWNSVCRVSRAFCLTLWGPNRTEQNIFHFMPGSTPSKPGTFRHTHIHSATLWKNCKRCSLRKKHSAPQLEPLFVLCAFQSAIFIHLSFSAFSGIPRLLLQGLTAVYLHKSRERLFFFSSTQTMRHNSESRKHLTSRGSSCQMRKYMQTHIF